MKKYFVLMFLLVVGLAACSTGPSNGVGTGTANVEADTVGGTISGLVGTVVLQNNAADDLTITVDGSFTFATELDDAETYAVTVLTQPTGQTCTVSNGSGTIATADVATVSVTCVTDSSEPEPEPEPERNQRHTQ